MNIAYVGTSHYRGFSKADFEGLLGDDADLGDLKFGANPTDASDKSKQLWFKQAEPTEVPDHVAEVLLKDAGLNGEFKEIKAEEDADAEKEADKAVDKAAKAQASKNDDQGAPTSGPGAHAQGSPDVAGASSGSSTAGSSTP